MANQSKIIEYGGLEVLVPLLHTPHMDTLTGAVAALRNLSIGRGNEVSTTHVHTVIIVVVHV